MQVADGDYHQGLGYVASFLHLYLSEEEVARVLVAMGRSEKHAKGYWKAKPEAFARDAMVFERLLEVTRLPPSLRPSVPPPSLLPPDSLAYSKGTLRSLLAFDQLELYRRRTRRSGSW